MSALLAGATPAAAADVDVDGYLQEAIGVTTGGGDRIFHRQTVNLKFEQNFSKLVLARLEADLWRDDPDFLESHARSRLREGYLRLRFENADVRLGRVQIAWGEAEGVVVSDQVSPFDIENFITPGFDEIRKGVDGVFVDYYFERDVALQVLWISHFEPPDFPNPKSPWYPIDLDELEIPGGGTQVDLQPFTRPSNTFENSEFGARMSGRPAALDWAIGYLRSWDDRPALHVRPSTDPLVLLAVPEHDQYDLVTANVVYPAFGMLFKVDAALEHGRYLQLQADDGADPTDPDLIEAFRDEFVARHDVLRTLAGLDLKPDVRGWEQADASFQWVHEEVFDPHPLLAVPDRVDLVSVLLRAAYLNDTLEPTLFGIVNLRGADLWVQAKLDYEPRDNWRVALEYDLFEGHDYDGNDGGIYGLFDPNDMVKASLRYSF